MRYSREALKRMARTALAARDANDDKWFLRISLGLGITAARAEQRIEELAR